MLAPITHILPMTVIRRERLLPAPGKVLVRAQQKVAATDTVAEANLQPEYLLLDVARGLGMPSEKADQFVKCHSGDRLAVGDVIAGPVGLTRRLIRSPRDGKVVLTGSGQVLIELTGTLFQVKATIPGVVTELIADRGAIIETTGALIQGVWGNGGVDFGVMTVLAKAPDQELISSEMDVSLRGSIVLGAHCADPEVLKSAEGMPLRGLILASMIPELMPIASKLGVPVIVIEGFGHRRMNSVAYKLLSTSDRREVAINAESWNRYAGTRPEVIIPLQTPSNIVTSQEVGTFAPDRRVRILRPPHAGEIGSITDLKGKVFFPGGLRAISAEVHLESGEYAVFPLENIELIA